MANRWSKLDLSMIQVTLIFHTTTLSKKSSLVDEWITRKVYNLFQDNLIEIDRTFGMGFSISYSIHIPLYYKLILLSNWRCFLKQMGFEKQTCLELRSVNMSIFQIVCYSDQYCFLVKFNLFKCCMATENGHYSIFLYFSHRLI